ncbi:MAG: SIMPL domain-containing protein [Candidatus Woesearchaeota archaeon]|jgi:hypothetical protein
MKSNSKELKGGKMEKSVKITLIIAVTILAVVLIGFNNLFPTSNTLTSNGDATISVVPDVIAVYLNVETTDKSAEIAKNTNAEIIEKIKTALNQQGFEDKEIETMSYNLYPQYSWSSGKQNLIGYQATHQLRVKMPAEDSDNIGSVIDAGVNSGATISYVSFELSPEKENEYKAEAMKLASQDAKTKAEAVASGLGKKVGRLVSVSTDSFNYYPYRVYEESAGSSMEDAKVATTNIQPSSQDVSASVTAVFKIN